MYDIGFVDKSGNIQHSILDCEFDCDMIDILFELQEHSECEVFSIQRVFLKEKEK